MPSVNRTMPETKNAPGQEPGAFGELSEAEADGPQTSCFGVAKMQISVTVAAASR